MPIIEANSAAVIDLAGRLDILAPGLDGLEYSHPSDRPAVRHGWCHSLSRSAKRIMEIAQSGARDQETLVENAFRFVAANYEEPNKRTR